jgi:DNA-binding transcriptional ArsR family regulator
MSGRLPDLTQLDRVMHEPARLMIVVTLLGVEEADFLYLQRECGLTQGNLSSHLAKLEEAGYVAIEKTFKGKFPMTICRLTEVGEAAFNRYSGILSGALRNGVRATRKRST